MGWLCWMFVGFFELLWRLVFGFCVFVFLETARLDGQKGIPNGVEGVYVI